MSPYATLAIWTGFDNPHTISNTTVATSTFNKVMSSYLSGMEHKDFKFPSNLIEAQYSPYSGLIVSTENVSGKYVGYYTEDNMPSNGGWDGYYDSSDSDNYDDYNYDSSSNYSDSSYSGDESHSGGGDGDTSSAESQGGEEPKPEESGGDTSSAESQGGEEPKPEESGGNVSAPGA